jgi:hypothetical protein
VLGFDVTNATMLAATWDVISNTEAIAVNQGWAGLGGRLAATSQETFQAVIFHGAANDIKDKPAPLPAWQVWTKPLSKDGSIQAVLVANYHPTEAAGVSVSLADLGFPSSVSSATARDVWAHAAAGKSVSSGALAIRVPATDSAFLILTAAAGGPRNYE